MLVELGLLEPAAEPVLLLIPEEDPALPLVAADPLGLLPLGPAELLPLAPLPLAPADPLELLPLRPAELLPLAPLPLVPDVLPELPDPLIAEPDVDAEPDPEPDPDAAVFNFGCPVAWSRQWVAAEIAPDPELAGGLLED